MCIYINVNKHKIWIIYIIYIRKYPASMQFKKRTPHFPTLRIVLEKKQQQKKHRPLLFSATRRSAMNWAHSSSESICRSVENSPRKLLVLQSPGEKWTWNLQMPPNGKENASTPNHQFLGSMLIFRGVIEINFMALSFISTCAIYKWYPKNRNIFQH